MTLHRKNDVTGAELVTKAATEEYREGHSRIFGDKLPWYKRRDLEKQVEANSRNSPIITDGYRMREELGLHTESALDHLAHRDAEMSDREWAAQPANLREGCTVHVDGVGDI
jgi:hypothetical protein